MKIICNRKIVIEISIFFFCEFFNCLPKLLVTINYTNSVILKLQTFVQFEN